MSLKHTRQTRQINKRQRSRVLNAVNRLKVSAHRVKRMVILNGRQVMLRLNVNSLNAHLGSQMTQVKGRGDIAQVRRNRTRVARTLLHTITQLRRKQYGTQGTGTTLVMITRNLLRFQRIARNVLPRLKILNNLNRHLSRIIMQLGIKHTRTRIMGNLTLNLGHGGLIIRQNGGLHTGTIRALQYLRNTAFQCGGHNTPAETPHSANRRVTGIWHLRPLF